MPGKRALPLVAICGRPNVGKSTLFNRITGKQRAIVHSVEGITRDRAYGVAEWRGRTFRVVDTGGVVEKPSEAVDIKTQEQVRRALEEARAIIFLVDGREEITRTDEELCQDLFRLGKPVVLAVNKLDNAKLAELRAEFYRLGMGEPYAVSETHGLGVEELLDAVLEDLPESVAAPEEEEERAVTKVAIVGKPNVGKSSFVNALLNEDRIIVDERPGTTRDAIDTEFHWKGTDYLLIDTAGLRKKAGIKKHVEFFSVSRALRAIRRADVCLVMIDPTEGVSEQDKRIFEYIQKSGTAAILVWTKWDLVENKEAKYKSLGEEIGFKLPFVKYLPFLTVSTVSRKRLFATFEYIDRVAAAAEKRVGTGELNRLMETIRASHTPSSHKGKYAKILYATQASIKPTTFVLFVNRKRLFHFSYVRFIENRIRQKYGFEGVPIRLELREGEPK